MKSARLEGKSIHMTKFVECPVVDRVPLLDNTFSRREKVHEQRAVRFVRYSLGSVLDVHHKHWAS